MGAGLASFIQLIFHLMTFIVMLRFLLHLSKADYFNPITQGVVSATNPVVRPMQMLLRPVGRIDPASFLLAVVIKALGIFLVLQMHGQIAGLGSILVGGVAGAVKTALDIYFFALIISIILSWVAPQASHPGALLVHQLIEPLLAPVRRFIPSLGGLDLSPIFVFLGLNLVTTVLVGILAQMAGMPVAALIGF